LISLPVPPPNKQVFAPGIYHPDLYLWDSWSCNSAQGVDLFCLALARNDHNGNAVSPVDRNNYFFHIRHFHSDESLMGWIDQGCFQQPGQSSDGHDARNIWSGSVIDLYEAGQLFSYTGIQQGDNDHPFIQSLAIAYCDKDSKFSHGNTILCPVQDREMILNAGYYLAEGENLGYKNGEQGGPIMAWRDPFLFKDANDNLLMTWAAKATSSKGSLGLAKLTLDKQFNCSVETLYPPVTLPDDEEFSQLELPKIYHNPVENYYILCISTTNRKSEYQPQSEIVMKTRLYTSANLNEGWNPAGTHTSIVEGIQNQFGMSVLKADYRKGHLYCMAPYTENAKEELQLSFPPVFTIDLNTIGSTGTITANR
jgi:hypothetical protein